MQFDFGDLESPLSGSNFINANLEPWRDALHTLHKGPSTPSYAVAGMMWIDDSGSPWVLNIFDGTDNISVGTVDPTTNTFTPSGVSQAAADISVDNSGFTVFGGDDVQEVLGEVDTLADSLGTAAFEDVGDFATAAQGALADALINSGFLNGLDAANTSGDTEHDITIQSGAAVSDDFSAIINISAAITKRFDATFAEGNNNGGMASGESLPTSGTVHIWLIGKPDGTVDVCGNNHASSGLTPTLPSGFTTKRRIASWTTDASANFFDGKYEQGEFTLKTVVNVVNTASLGTTASLFAVGCPLGIEAKFKGSARISISGTANILITSPSQTDSTPSATLSTLSSSASSADNVFFDMKTDTSGQLRARSDAASTSLRINQYGWIDSREI